MWDLTIQDDHDFYVLATAGSDAYNTDADGTLVLVHNEDEACPVTTVYHYTSKKNWNGIRGGGNLIKASESKNGFGVFVTDRSPADLTAPNAFKKLGITSAKSEYMLEFQVPKDSLVPLRGGRGSFIFSIPGDVSIPKENLLYSGPVDGWEG
jgi:hypothetical protein